METKQNKSSKIVFLAVIALVCSWAMFSNAGSLNPSAPPGPTMKTLDEVEPRIPVQTLSASGTALYVISQSGSYYLTGNINGETDKHGIEIDANNITIDLNGYSLIGPGKTVGSSGDGIYASNSYSNIVVRNGHSFDWRQKGIYLLSENARVQNVNAFNNGNIGIEVGNASIVKNCISQSNGDDGINTGARSIISNCVAKSNSSAGIAAGNGSTIIGCVASANYEGIDCSRNCSVIDCSVSYNADVGIQGSSSSTIKNCSVVDNGGYGIEAHNGSVVSNCAIRNNLDAGIRASNSLVIGNATYNNTPNLNLTTCTSVNNYP